ncbi:MAG: glycosyltransferase [bacterium]|nr:glycosyltransferase [bacterium]
MKLLFVLSQIELTGAETYAVSLTKKLKSKGYRIVFVSDTLNSKNIGVPYYPLDLDNRKSFVNRFRHIRFLCQMIRKERIDLIHAHSRASSWVAYFASRITNIPLVTTAHCIYPVHLSRKFLPCFGKKVIAICESVRDHLIKDLKVNPKDIFLIPNGIDIHRFRPNIDSAVREEFDILREAKVISWIGRFSGPRGRIIEEVIGKVFPEILKVIPNLKLLIVAGGNRPFSLKSKVEAINHQFKQEIVKFTGLRSDIPQIYALSDLVIGAGRVAIEAMACGCPVLAVGENKFVGLINPQSIEEGIYNNFGDCCKSEQVNWEGLTKTIMEIFKDEKEANKLSQWGRKVTIDRFDLEKVTEEVEKVYEKALE